MIIGKYLRNILLQQPETYVLKIGKKYSTASLINEVYTYPTVTEEEIMESIQNIRELLDETDDSPIPAIIIAVALFFASYGFIKIFLTFIKF